jgi:hypothetical protein
VLAIFISPTNPKVIAFKVVAALTTSSAILTILYLFYRNRGSNYIIRPYRSTTVDL